jgi:hypothetical protein
MNMESNAMDAGLDQFALPHPKPGMEHFDPGRILKARQQMTCQIFELAGVSYEYLK